MVVIFNLLTFLWMFPLGLSEAACTVIGNEIGANNPFLAKKYLKLTAGLAIPTCFVVLVLMYILRHAIASIYFVGYDDATLALKRMLANGMQLMCLLGVFDHI